MKQNSIFLKETCAIAVPVALQCMLQASFNIVDQIMIGQLGSTQIAAIGLAGKFSSIFTVVIGAVATVASIMIAQYIGAKEKRQAERSFSVNLFVMVLVAAFFSILCLFLPNQIMDLYSTDNETIETAAVYLQITGISFLPLSVNTCAATMFRCMDAAKIPLYISFLAAMCNTGLNYVLIFGKFGFPALGVTGAAVATTLSAILNMIITLLMLTRLYRKKELHFVFGFRLGTMSRKEYLLILAPILINELLWSIGENIYGAIYGHIGTDSCAAMTLTNPIQGLLIGAMSGFSSAAGILIGKRLGKADYESAYRDSKKLICYGVVGSLILSTLLILFRTIYVDIYQVNEIVKQTGSQLLAIFACYLPVKVTNMILGGGILRSGGNTKLILVVDLIGTWLIGVPVGFFTAFVWELPITWVYLCLSLEEIVRLIITAVLFKKKLWMQNIAG